MMEGDGDDCTQEMDRVLLLHGVPVGSELAAAGGNLPGQGAAPIGSGQAAAAEQGLRRGHPDGAEAAVGRAAAAFGRGQPIAAEEGTLGRGATAFGRGDAAGVEGAVARGTATIGRSQVAAVDGGMGLGTAAFCRGLTAGVARSYGRCAAALGRGLVTARFGASAATTGRGQMSASGHQSSSPAAGAIQAGRAQFAGTLHHDATLEAASDAGVYGLGGSGNGSNVEDGPLDGAVRYYREGDEGYVPPFDATDEQYYSLCLDMNGDTSRGRNHGRGLGRSRGFTLPRQARSAVARGRGRGRSRGRGLTTSVNEVQPIVSAGQNANAVVVNGSTSQRSAKNPIDSQVSSRFFQMTGIELSKIQLNNKWEKLKGDLTAWRKLMRRQTGTGWDHLRHTIEMDPEWWRKIKAEIPGCAKFKKGPLQNEADLIKMFDKITNDESDHWNPMTENPIILESQEPIINLEDDFVDVECDIPNDFTSPSSDVVKEVSPSVCNGKKRPRVVLGKPGRKTKTSIAAIMKEQVTRIADSADALASKKLGEVTIKQVMELVVACGAVVVCNEHFIASKLFIKREQREMFVTLDTHESRFLWLSRHYNEQYKA